MGMAWLQRLGHTPIALVGGGTGMVGDPSGKRERAARAVAGADRPATRAARCGSCERFLSFEGANAARLRNNADWLRGLSLMEFLRDTGQALHRQLHAAEGVGAEPDGGGDLVHRVQLHADPGVRLLAPVPHRRLRAADGRQRPVGQHHRRHRADRTSASGRQVHGLVFPLITTRRRRQVRQERRRQRLARSGSAPARTTSTSSGSTPTTATSSATSSCSPSSGSTGSRRPWPSTRPTRAGARRSGSLAREVTATVHGDGGGRGGDPDQRGPVRRRADDGELPAEALADMPERRVSRAQLPDGLPVVEVLVASGLASSKADARRGHPGQGLLSQRPADRRRGAPARRGRRSRGRRRSGS